MGVREGRFEKTVHTCHHCYPPLLLNELEDLLDIYTMVDISGQVPNGIIKRLTSMQLIFLTMLSDTASRPAFAPGITSMPRAYMYVAGALAEEPVV